MSADIVREFSETALDALGGLVGRRVETKIVHGSIGDDGLRADEMLLLAWPRGESVRPNRISTVVALRGHIEEGIWISIDAIDYPQPDLLALGVVTDAPGGRFSWARVFRLMPTPKSVVTDVSVFSESFTLEADEESPARRVRRDCRFDIGFDRGEPFCFEVGAFGDGFFHIHRDRSSWKGTGDPDVAVLRQSFGQASQPVLS